VRHVVDGWNRLSLVSRLRYRSGRRGQRRPWAGFKEPAVAHGFTRSGVGYSKPKIVPEDADLAKAADILNAGSKVAILIGAGARGTAPLLIETATLLGAGLAKALLGKDVLPDDLPFVTGALAAISSRSQSPWRCRRYAEGIAADASAQGEPGLV
jgi:hypothetical protein